MANIYAYKAGSESAALLSQELGIKRIKHTGSKFRGNGVKTVINWGSSDLPEEVQKCNIINTTDAIKICANKLRWFEAMSNTEEVNTPEFTTDIEVARGWLGEDSVVLCRTLLEANSGRGIVIAEEEEDLVNAKLYTRYIPKRNEYRVHVFNDKVLTVQRKALRNDAPRQDGVFRIQNADNGFIFARNEGHQPPDCVLDQGLAAIGSVDGLMFGAVDIIYNQYRDKAYVLEVNTAPGLTGTTLQEYVEAFHEVI